VIKLLLEDDLLLSYIEFCQNYLATIKSRIGSSC
jgi:hypothetical protein